MAMNDGGRGEEAGEGGRAEDDAEEQHLSTVFWTAHSEGR
jgi:hypothetical protein